jgi:alanine racemase
MSIDPFHAYLTIDLDALAHNYAALQRQARGAKVAAVVKADAYGLGANQVAARLWAEGARQFFVARISEGEDLRSALGPDRPATIYVLDGAPSGSAPRLQASNLTPVLNSFAQVSEWSSLGRSVTGGLRAALQIDTGMNRLGLRLEEAKALVQSMDALRGLSIDLVISHLACASEPAHPANAAQLASFQEARSLFPEARASLANSAGVFLGQDYLFDLVRPGISLYGGGPFGVPHPSLRPVARLTAPILQIREIRPGESVGYGATFTAEQPVRAAIIAAGYADGVLRSFSNSGLVWLGGAYRKVLGRLSMDMTAIEISHDLVVAPGDLVELLGDHVALDDAASASGTIAYECLVRLAPRLQRTYRGSKA